MNELSSGEGGDNSLRLDGEEIQLAHYDGMNSEEKYYLRHKDAFKVDLNNLQDG